MMVAWHPCPASTRTDSSREALPRQDTWLKKHCLAFFLDTFCTQCSTAASSQLKLWTSLAGYRISSTRTSYRQGATTIRDSDAADLLETRYVFCHAHMCDDSIKGRFPTSIESQRRNQDLLDLMELEKNSRSLTTPTGSLSAGDLAYCGPEKRSRNASPFRPSCTASPVDTSPVGRAPEARTPHSV
jgi:hypothetical protein